MVSVKQLALLCLFLIASNVDGFEIFGMCLWSCDDGSDGTKNETKAATKEDASGGDKGEAVAKEPEGKFELFGMCLWSCGNSTDATAGTSKEKATGKESEGKFELFGICLWSCGNSTDGTAATKTEKAGGKKPESKKTALYDATIPTTRVAATSSWIPSSAASGVGAEAAIAATVVLFVVWKRRQPRTNDDTDGLLSDTEACGSVE